jgi:myo-inositol-1(or 4)-monophosphatase
VACGRLDAYYERDLKPWDWAAGRLLVSEAGGAVRELEGDPTCMVVATDEALMEALAALI